MAALASAKGGPSATDLLAKAEALLRQHEDEAVKEHVAHESKRELAAAVLQSAIEVATEYPTKSNMHDLELAVQGALRSGQIPELRVKARQLLKSWRQANARSETLEAEVKRLTRQLASLNSKLTAHWDADGLGQSSTSTTASSSETAAAQAAKLRHRQDVCLSHLKRALDGADATKVSEQWYEDARDLVEQVEAENKSQELATRRLEGLLNINSAEELEEALLEQDAAALTSGGQPRRMLNEVAGHVLKMAEQEQLQAWLMKELAIAAENSDLIRLRQLIIQSNSLKLAVPPAMLAHLDKLEQEARDTAFSSTSTFRSVRSDWRERSTEFQSRRHEMLQAAVQIAEEDPNMKTIDAAKKALIEAKQTRAPEEKVAHLEKRLVILETRQLPKIQVEDRLQALIDASEEFNIGSMTDVILVADEQIKELSEALAESRKWETDPDLLEEAEDLYKRSYDVQQLRVKAEQELRWALAKSGRSEMALERVQTAVEECRKLGVKTFKAGRELNRLREAQVNREAAEAELVEASKGLGFQGRARLEAAVRAAKGVGVSADKLRAASRRLNELAEHEQRCTVLAGELQRLIPSLSKEPWRYQQLVEAANMLKPWTPKLERLIQQGQQILKKSHDEQSRSKEAQTNLRSQIKKIEENRSIGQPIQELLGPLQALLEEAKRCGVPEAILREGQLQLRNVKREGNQRAVAEHRLRLALSARDHMEIERSMRQVRALGQVGLSDQNSSQGPGGGANIVRSEHPNSARLMDAAGSMLRHLGEAAARRQTAAAALQQHLSGSGGDGMGTQADAVISQGWLKEAQTALVEAEKCGVAPTVIEQAKIKIRTKRREHQEQQDALKALQKVLSKKDAPQAVLQARMRRVQRLQASPDTFTDGFTNTTT